MSDGAIHEIDVRLRSFVRADGTTGNVRRTDSIAVSPVTRVMRASVP